MAETNKAGTDTRRGFLLLGIAIVLIAVAIGGFYYYQSTSSRNSSWRELSKAFSVDAESLSKAGRYSPPDFITLGSLTEDYDANVKAMVEGDPAAGIVAAPAEVQDRVAAVAEAWKKMKLAIDAILQNEDSYDKAVSGVADFTQQADALLDQQVTPQEVALLERMKAAATLVVSAGRDAVASASALRSFSNDFTRLANGATATAFKPMAQIVDDLFAAAPNVEKVQQSAATLQGNALNLIAAAKNLEQGLIDTLVVNKALPYISLGASVLALLLIVAFVYQSITALRERNRKAEERDARQQQAILGLLDEITNLADGDLTVDVTVTEDFTGAIADSFNYTVGNMRNLVGTINTTSADIGAAASSTQQVALQMNEASERQAREITAVTNTIAATSQSLQQVAASAEKLAQQAQNSVQVAHNGAETVGRTIQGMAALREQIQDTSKRIKRLGESSQEIGNIIEFINDIAEQTNTLALNASIQAAMAGEQGRGFAVVADEVQRLAERAATATRQIENLVKTIQADTNEAIISMERSTTNVVSGAKSAEEAGQALTKVETSSQELSRLIQEISGSARNQSAAATKIAGTMQIIREIAVQTSGSAGQTAQAVGELNTLSEKLRESVAGFKLP
jgi:twitching motility protein PilJ